MTSLHMRHSSSLIGLLALAAFLAACSPDSSGPAGPSALHPELIMGGGSPGTFVTANRASGTISVVSASDGSVSGTYALPQSASDNPPEPMYVVYVALNNSVLVGDRANDRVVAFDAADYSVLGTASAGQGVFHMWVSGTGTQLWVNNDIDNTASVIDPVTLTTIATVPMPADLVASGGKPHDVILSYDGSRAYVSMLGLAGPDDYVVQFETATFAEVNRAAVGQDPHVSLNRNDGRLYVAAQNSNLLSVVDRISLASITDIALPGAHGVGMSNNGKHLYVTNLPGAGTDALFTLDTKGLALTGDVLSTPFPVPHNVAVSRNGRRIAVTHSGGTADKLSLFVAEKGVPSFLVSATVGLNPFGIAFVP
jgi:YVTN family beta-propeller protein